MAQALLSRISFSSSFRLNSPSPSRSSSPAQSSPRRGFKRSNAMRLPPFRSQASSPKCKVVTFVGGAGKTFSAIIAAKFYASIGLKTCLLVQSQDPTAEFILGHKLGCVSSVLDGGVLTTARVESTKLLSELLNQLKKVDADLSFTQGALDEIFENELGILPGMDLLLSLSAVEQLADFSNGLIKTADTIANKRFDVIVYDGPSSEELFRVFGAAERARQYIKRLRSIVEKTDYGRVALPSLLRFFEAAFIKLSPNAKVSRTTGEIWGAVDDALKQVADNFMNPKRFSCYLVADVNNILSIDTAFRYWGCAMQAGAYVAGLLFLNFSNVSSSTLKEKFLPLPIASVPYISVEDTIKWDEVLGKINDDVKTIFRGELLPQKLPPPVAFDRTAQTICLFLPGFVKSEIKLSQMKGGSELLVDAGDQRRVISLPPGFPRKVSAAKFHEKTLIISFKDNPSL